MEIIAILSTTVLPLDGTYFVQTITEDMFSGMPDITGVPHYIGHPDTKEIVERLGAVKAEFNLFTGLQEGEVALVVSIKQGMSTRKVDGFTTPHQNVTIDMLDFRLLYRRRKEKIYMNG